MANLHQATLRGMNVYIYCCADKPLRKKYLLMSLVTFVFIALTTIRDPRVEVPKLILRFDPRTVQFDFKSECIPCIQLNAVRLPIGHSAFSEDIYHH